MKIVAIIPAAGKGKRLKKRISKALVLLNGKPIFIHTLKVLSKIKLINDIIVVANRDDLTIFKEKINRYKIRKVKKVISGGVTRSQSVRNGLKQVEKDVDFVFVHDGARPFIDKEIVSEVIRKAKRFGAAITAVPVKPTIKIIDKKKRQVLKTLDRSQLWEIQTPQVFKKQVIERAYKKLKKRVIQASDDAYLVEKLKHKVMIVKGSYKNIKITTPEDLVFARALLK